MLVPGLQKGDIALDSNVVCQGQGSMVYVPHEGKVYVPTNYV